MQSSRRGVSSHQVLVNGGLWPFADAVESKQDDIDGELFARVEMLESSGI
jgi:hypothetical protein